MLSAIKRSADWTVKYLQTVSCLIVLSYNLNII